MRLTLPVLSLREVEAGQPSDRYSIVEVCGRDVRGSFDEVDFGFAAHKHLRVIDEDSEPGYDEEGTFLCFHSEAFCHR